MKKLLSILLFIYVFCLTTNCYSQNCGTEFTEEQIEYMNISKLNRKSYIKSNSNIKWFPIQNHIIRETDCTENIDDSDIQLIMDQINNHYFSSGIQFFQYTEPHIICDSENYNFIKSEEEICNVADLDKVINVYYVNSILNENEEDICGYAYFPSGINSINRIFINNACALNGSTIIHELGHYFSLLHTHETFFGSEYVNGDNCTIAGDQLCDTPADPKLQINNSFLVNEFCEYIGSEIDPNGEYYSPSTTNFMSYSTWECRDDFTLEQRNQISYSADYERNYLNFLDFEPSQKKCLEMILSEDFESYDNYNYIASQSSELWSTWSNMPGGTEDVIVVPESPSNENKLLQLSSENSSDLVLIFDEQNSSAFTLSFMMKIEQGKGAYFNLLHEFDGANSNWASQFFFNSSGNGDLIVGNGSYNDNFSHPIGEWFEVKITVDVYTNYANLFFNNIIVSNWDWSEGSEGISSMLGGLNFYPYNEDGEEDSFYVDNIFLYNNIICVSGCTQLDACNFDQGANLNDNSCEYPQNGFDCEGNCLDDDGDEVCNFDEIPQIFFSSPDSLTYSLTSEEILIDSIEFCNTGENELDIIVGAPFLNNSTNQINLLNTYNTSLSSSSGMVYVDSLFYVIDWSNNVLSSYNPNTMEIITLFGLHTMPYGIIWDGNSFWIGNDMGYIYQYFLDGSMGSFIGTWFGNYTSLSFDGEYIYSQNVSSNNMYQIDLDGNIINSFITSNNFQSVYVTGHYTGSFWVLNDNLSLQFNRLELNNQNETSSVGEIQNGWGYNVDNYAIAHDGSDLWILDWQGNLFQFNDGIVENDPIILTQNQCNSFTFSYLMGDVYEENINQTLVINSNDPHAPIISIPVSININIYNDYNNCINDLDFDNVCDELENIGCAFSWADNYNNFVSEDDGTCFRYGCTFDWADNFDQFATIDNNSCYRYGCTSDLAINFDQFATIDNESCVLPIYGCMDSMALNYNLIANTDNEDCQYPCSVPDSWDYTVTDINHTIVIPSISIDFDSLTIDIDNSIGGFYTNEIGEMKCAGYSDINSETIAFAIMGDDATTDQIDGFQVGEELVFKIWDVTSCQEYSIFPSYASGPNSFSVNAITLIESFDSNFCQNIFLPGGWYIYSSYIETEEMNTEQMMISIHDNLQIVKDNNGSVYLPEFTFNGIGDLNVDYGYQIKTLTSDTLSLCGTYASPENNPIQLYQGWNIVGYLGLETKDVISVFQEINNTNNLILVKDYLGSIYIPEYGFNGIGFMMPGQGYQIKLNESGILEY